MKSLKEFFFFEIQFQAAVHRRVLDDMKQRRTLSGQILHVSRIILTEHFSEKQKD